MTDGSYSEDESHSGSDQETEDEPEKATPNRGRPREFMAPTNLTPQGNHGVPGPPRPPGQGPSLHVLPEIRNMIKEECMVHPFCSIYAVVDVFCREAGAESNTA